MAIARVKLHGPPFPQGHTEKEIRKDPLRCHICCNLFPGSACSLFPRKDIFVSEYSGIINARASAALNQEREERVPQWAGTSRLDWSAWQFSARLIDVAQEAQKGCTSCFILRAGIEGLADDAVSFEDADLEMDIVFCRGNVMRLWVNRMSQASEDDDNLFGALITEASKPEEQLIACEFYTLPGMAVFFIVERSSGKKQDISVLPNPSIHPYRVKSNGTQSASRKTWPVISIISKQLRKAHLNEN